MAKEHWRGLRFPPQCQPVSVCARRTSTWPPFRRPGGGRTLCIGNPVAFLLETDQRSRNCASGMGPLATDFHTRGAKIEAPLRQCVNNTCSCATDTGLAAKHVSLVHGVEGIEPSLGLLGSLQGSRAWAAPKQWCHAGAVALCFPIAP